LHQKDQRSKPNFWKCNLRCFRPHKRPLLEREDLPIFRTHYPSIRRSNTHL